MKDTLKFLVTCTAEFPNKDARLKLIKEIKTLIKGTEHIEDGNIKVKSVNTIRIRKTYSDRFIDYDTDRKTNNT